MSTIGRVTRHLVQALKKVRLAALVLTLIVSGALGFGISGGDVQRMRAFGDAVRRWQVNPDFRAVQREYVTLGVEAMRGRWCAVSAERIVLAVRSAPGLPAYISVNESSAAHYRAFSTGELSAYLHLSGEQNVAGGVEMIEKLAARNPPTDGEIVEFLDGFKLPVKIVTDAGAILSVRRLLADTQQPPRPFTVRDDLLSALRRHVPRDFDTMTRPQQADMLRGLDDVIKSADPELWRTKQVSDFLGGIWAQGYGQIYLDGIEWLMWIRTAARVAMVVAMVLLVWLLVRSHRPSVTCVAVGHLDPGPLTSGDKAK
ncbi:MAG: hypothetical protein QOE14_1959 [Humisphaera sp.]|nr:hypothetical protein [Humisphaera sp.]